MTPDAEHAAILRRMNVRFDPIWSNERRAAIERAIELLEREARIQTVPPWAVDEGNPRP